MREWFDNESFWIQMYPYMFPEARYEAAQEQVEKILGLVGVKDGAVLDLCCGPGRHVCVLARKGFRVTGVDLTPFLLDKAKERGRAAGVDVEWIHEDMRSFVRSNGYDLVLSMFTSFGYFDDKEEDLKVLHNIHESLKPAGVCVVDVMGKERIAKILAATTSERYPDGALLVQRHEIFDDWSRIRNEWILIKDDQATSFTFHHTVYSGQELKDRLLQVGFAKVRLFGNLDGDEYGPEATRLIAVAQKRNNA